MESKDIRKQNLEALLADYVQSGKLTKAAFAERCGITPSVLSQIIGVSPNRNIGDRMARKIEESLGVSKGWMDSIHDDISPGLLPQPASAQRVSQILDENGWSQSELARRLGISPQSVQYWVSGKTSPRGKSLSALSSLTGYPEHWFLMDFTDPLSIKDAEKPMRLEESQASYGSIDAWDESTPLSPDEVEVPFLRDIEFACGDGRIQSEDHNGFKLRFSKSTLRKVGANTDGSGVLCFPARGNSMEPNIPDGTTVAVNTNDKKIVDGKMYAISQNGWNRIKLLYRTGPDTVSIRSYNSDEHPAEEKPISSIEIIGRVFWWSYVDY
ncbi:helix-turn-helix domain-containing protein [Pectobacterium carotovorum]